MANEDCPCRFCTPPKRQTGCHGFCPDWAEWKPKQMEKIHKIWEKKKKQNMLDNYSAKAVEHNKSRESRAIGNKRWKDAYRSRMDDNP